MRFLTSLTDMYDIFIESWYIVSIIFAWIVVGYLMVHIWRMLTSEPGMNNEQKSSTNE